MAAVEGRHGLRCVVQEGLAGTKDRKAIGVIQAALLEQLLKGHLFWLILTLGEFLEHHLALHVEVLGVQPGLEHQIRE